jgi:8-oxo-dGTP diphosphatase
MSGEASTQTPEPFPTSLPTMQVGSGCLFRDGDGRLLLVKPTYKENWDLPGGAVEEGESPLAACRRELLEELGIDVAPACLLAVDYRMPVAGKRGSALRFVFDGGVLDEERLSTIRLDPGELSDFRFVAAGDLDDFTTPVMAARLRSIVSPPEGSGSLYLEEGTDPLRPAEK